MFFVVSGAYLSCAVAQSDKEATSELVVKGLSIQENKYPNFDKGTYINH